VGYSLELQGDAAACGLHSLQESSPPNDGTLCETLCKVYALECSLGEDGTNSLVQCFSFERCGGGRRPGGLAAAARTEASALGAYFARAAWLEAASVDAFQILREELAAHAAPQELIDGAVRAAADERRHAAMMSALASRFGASAPQPVVARVAVRSIVDIAVENAIEGCVGETLAALTARYQSRTASDASVRAAMGRIARDELRHAALAWGVAEWAWARLRADERERVRAAMRRAVRAAESASRCQPPQVLRDEAGLAETGPAQRMVGELARSLWRSASGGAAANV
jgi:hypothetical protein